MSGRLAAGLGRGREEPEHDACDNGRGHIATETVTVDVLQQLRSVAGHGGGYNFVENATFPITVARVCRSSVRVLDKRVLTNLR